MATISKEFKEIDFDSTKRKFYGYLGKGNEWFADMLYDVKTRYNSNPKASPVTDILVRQGQPIYLTVVKPNIIYSPPRQEDGSKKRNPTDSDIREIVQKFYNKEENREWRGLLCAFSFSVDGLGIYRVNFSSGINGSVLSIRILSYDLPSFGYVSYPQFFQDYIKSFVGQANVSVPGPKRSKDGEEDELINMSTQEVTETGLILHVGPTGSGKTTAIASEFGFLAESTSVTMVTFENPIEYRYILTKAPVEQYEIGVDVTSGDGRSEFENVMRLFLRSSASVALIGEARNRDEIKILIDIASRGHLVFSTIHATNVYDALSSLVSHLDKETYMLAGALKAIVAHKLIRNKRGEVFGLHEILIINPTLRNFIAKGDLQSIKRIIYQESQGLLKQTFEESLINLERDGKISTVEKMNILENNMAIFSDK